MLTEELTDPSPTADLPWWMDGRNVSALGSWLVDGAGIEAREIYDVYEHPDRCDHLWSEFQGWVGQADER